MHDAGLGRLRKESALVNFKQPVHQYKRGGHGYVMLPEHLAVRGDKGQSAMMWRANFYPTKYAPRISSGSHRSVHKEAERMGIVMLSRQQVYHQILRDDRVNP